MSETCVRCHRPLMSLDDWTDEGRWTAGHIPVCGTVAASSDIRYPLALQDCAEARDRWLTARVADLEAVIEAVREACELADRSTYGAHVEDLQNAVRAEIAALLPPKKAEDA